MANLRKGSTFFFVGTLSPDSDCVDMQPGELSLGEGWTLDVCYSLISIWNPAVTGSFDEVKRFAADAIDLLARLVSFRWKRNLLVRLEDWIEVKGVVCEKNVIGRFVGDWNRHPRRPSRSNNPRVNVHWQRAAKAFSHFNESAPDRLAVKDFTAALRESGDDAFLFANRAVEDLCRAYSPNGKVDKQGWNRLHADLGTTRQGIQRLVDAATSIRHGDRNSDAIRVARTNRRQALDSGRAILMARFRKHIKGFV